MKKSRGLNIDLFHNAGTLFISSQSFENILPQNGPVASKVATEKTKITTMFFSFSSTPFFLLAISFPSLVWFCSLSGPKKPAFWRLFTQMTAPFVRLVSKQSARYTDIWKNKWMGRHYERGQYPLRFLIIWFIFILSIGDNSTKSHKVTKIIYVWLVNNSKVCYNSSLTYIVLESNPSHFFLSTLFPYRKEVGLRN